MALFIFISDLYYVNLCVFEQIAADLAIHQLQFHTLGLGYKELVSLALPNLFHITHVDFHVANLAQLQYREGFRMHLP